jgi:hypothetical protein
VAELHVVRNDFLPCLDRQVTGDAVRLEMIFFADNEAEESLQSLGLLDTEVTLSAPGRITDLALRATLLRARVHNLELLKILQLAATIAKSLTGNRFLLRSGPLVGRADVAAVVRREGWLR